MGDTNIVFDKDIFFSKMMDMTNKYEANTLSAVSYNLANCSGAAPSTINNCFSQYDKLRLNMNDLYKATITYMGAVNANIEACELDNAVATDPNSNGG
ncbi:MAG: hypothetical protein K6F83_03325 [Clostridiales bacterium]|nr:hypothetical protein [Clostridiales bacterium]